jgi:hypothetical protein
MNTPIIIEPGWLPDDDLTREWLQHIADYRARVDEEERRRLEEEDNERSVSASTPGITNMNFPIFIVPAPGGSGFRAALGAPFNCTIEAPTSDEVESKAADLIREQLQNGGRIHWISVPAMVSRSPVINDSLDEEIEREHRAAIEEYRRQCDEEDRRRIDEDAAPNCRIECDQRALR